MAIGNTSYEDFVRQIKHKTGLDLSLYKQEQMKRRLHGSMERSGVKDYGEYLSLIERDSQVKQIFMDRLTINVSELFRNPEHFKTLGSKVIPTLLEKSRRKIKMWSAGCSYGAEAVSLAILATECAPAATVEVIATDIDETILKKAAQGEFADPDMKNVSSECRQKWFTNHAGIWKAKPEVMSRIHFQKHNLLADSAPGIFDLVVCRNVVIYFSDSAKEHVNRLLVGSLRPGGSLFIGGTERIPDYEKLGLINPIPFFYFKPG